MAFPDIKTNLPVGTQMVSTIDDFERETRTWLKQCMQEISGYPDVNTVGVKGWTNNTRPSSNPNSNYLLGYNTQTKQLELIGSDGTVTQVLSDETKKSIALLAHPVGSYYYTSNTNFNPNTAWGGTWVRIQDGRCLISDNSSHSVGSTGGSETVTLSLSHMPAHQHPHNHKHSHGKGSMDITGSFPIDDIKLDANGDYSMKGSALSGAFYYNGGFTGKDNANGNGNTSPICKFQASRSWVGETTPDSTPASNHIQGGGQAHNNMPPYRTAVCWHRTA